ncbi:MAG: transcription elongation factor GreA [Candidatus Omnitrophica bacterium]|nr:transcription elongation factor GreA [Candidatus Omnitrophota bacterium]
MGRNILTPQGFEKLKEELNFLQTKKRREVADMLEKARAHGDLRENAEYDAAKEAKKQLEARIAMLQERIAGAEIVNPDDLPSDKAYLGTTLEIENIETGDQLKYTLVTEDETDFNAGKISVTSPIGKGLLGKGLDEVVEINVPAGQIKLKIKKITREK